MDEFGAVLPFGVGDVIEVQRRDCLVVGTGALRMRVTKILDVDSTDIRQFVDLCGVHLSPDGADHHEGPAFIFVPGVRVISSVNL